MLPAATMSLALAPALVTVAAPAGGVAAARITVAQVARASLDPVMASPARWPLQPSAVVPGFP